MSAPEPTVTVLVDVTQADIDSSPAGCDGGDCPVWRAARRVLPGVEGLWITVAAIISGPWQDPLTVAPLPPEAITFIRLLSLGVLVDPFSFKVQVPAWAVQAPAEVTS